MTELLKYKLLKIPYLCTGAARSQGLKGFLLQRLICLGSTSSIYNPGEFNHQLDWGKYFTLSVYLLNVVEAETGQGRTWLRAGIKLCSLLVNCCYLLIRLNAHGLSLVVLFRGVGSPI